MKTTFSFRLIVMTIACATAFVVHAQSDTITVVYGEEERDSLLVTSIDQMPEFPGGIDALKDFLHDNLRYPEEAKKKGIEGRVVVQFWIESDSTIADVVVISKPNPLLDAEAVRLVRSMPKWKPATQKGKPVRCRYTVPVHFKSDEENKVSADPEDDFACHFGEEMPEFPGGVGALMNYLKTNLRYPKAAQEMGVGGRVVVQFWVDVDGTVTNPVVTKSAHKLLDDEALRLVRNMPKWKPGRNSKGEVEAMLFNLPIQFQLSTQESKKRW